MENWLLERLVCPVSRQRLRRAAESDVSLILARVEEGLDIPEDLDIPGVEAWLVTEDGHRAYPVIGDTPHLLTDQSLVL